MARTQAQLAAQMVAQLRVLDPSASAEIGTPERKILDTVAEAIAENQIDLNLTSGALDLSSKFGSDLDQFMAALGFGRQSGAYSKGFVTFSRPTPSLYDITIARGTQVASVADTVTPISFQTTQPVLLAHGATSVIAPIQALVQGQFGNVGAGKITQFANLGTPPLGITDVTNAVPTTNGADPELDAEFKLRFRNTVFRNMAGTQDQYLALAIATQFSTMAIVLGPVARFQEYMQVPPVDDASIDGTEPGGGDVGVFTSAISANPYTKHVYADLPYFVSNGSSPSTTFFYRQDTDFTFNAPPLDVGETHRQFLATDIPDPATTPNNPNVSFINVYQGDDPAVDMLRAGDIVLLEYAYLSSESRNDYSNAITNCVDVYVNGTNPTAAATVLPLPTDTTLVFQANPASKLYSGHFRRVGQPDVAPSIGNVFQPLFWQPVIDLPDQITVSDATYLKGINYWVVEDLTLLGGTVRSRNGIEWAMPFTPPTGATSITVDGYLYDRNIIDLQGALEGSKQVTTDVLAHRARTRFFKLDLTLVYRSSQGFASVNNSISATVSNYFASQYFGATIQLTTILSLVNQVPGVQNVRWTNDVVHPFESEAGSARLTETEVNGNPTPNGTPRTFEADFYLKDNELPSLPTGQISGDTLPGLILRPRAENNFTV